MRLRRWSPPDRFVPRQRRRSSRCWTLVLAILIGGLHGTVRAEAQRDPETLPILLWGVHTDCGLDADATEALASRLSNLGVELDKRMVASPRRCPGAVGCKPLFDDSFKPCDRRFIGADVTRGSGDELHTRVFYFSSQSPGEKTRYIDGICSRAELGETLATAAAQLVGAGLRGAASMGDAQCAAPLPAAADVAPPASATTPLKLALSLSAVGGTYGQSGLMRAALQRAVRQMGYELGSVPPGGNVLDPALIRLDVIVQVGADGHGDGVTDVLLRGAQGGLEQHMRFDCSGDECKKEKLIDMVTLNATVLLDSLARTARPVSAPALRASLCSTWSGPSCSEVSSLTQLLAALAEACKPLPLCPESEKVKPQGNRALKIAGGTLLGLGIVSIGVSGALLALDGTRRGDGLDCLYGALPTPCVWHTAPGATAGLVLGGTSVTVGAALLVGGWFRDRRVPPPPVDVKGSERCVRRPK